MKLIHCRECGDIVLLYPKIVMPCICGKIAGKYLSNGVTAVVSEDAIVVGIDNNGFNIANQVYDNNQELDRRIDIFFTGWIPNFPGEVIRVKLEDVVEYPYEVDYEEESTLPTNHEKKKQE